ncbi:TraB family protein [Methanosarcinales archaeon]|nr:MAG: TraB family protein [Methanosarcinales archaeon]
MESVRKVSVNGVEIILVGTGHILEKSVREVEEVIERENPDIIAVELCEHRYRALKGEIYEDFSVKDALSGGNPFLLLTQWLLAYIQRRMGSELGVEPGADMMAAIEKAEKKGIPFALVDRPIQITMQRFWNKMRFFEKVKMLFSLISAIFSMRKLKNDEDHKNSSRMLTDGSLDKLTDEDVVTQLLMEFRKFSPGAAAALLDERDAYIAAKLISLAKSLKSIASTAHQTSSPASLTDDRSSGKIVAVVGAGHREGILKYLRNPHTLPDISELCRLPAKKMFSLNFLLGAGLISVALLLVIGCIFSGVPVHTFLTALFWWFLINGSLSCAGVMIARGHPLSGVVAFAVAWLTSLNPLIAAGWFAGIEEAKIRKPSAEDLKKMFKAEKFSDLMSNKMFRVILVAALANIGSMIGSFIGFFVVLNVLNVDIHHVFNQIFNTILHLI